MPINQRTQAETLMLANYAIHYHVPHDPTRETRIVNVCGKHMKERHDRMVPGAASCYPAPPNSKCYDCRNLPEAV